MCTHRIYLSTGAAMLLLLVACTDSEPRQAAPLGERQVLQQLADAYDRVRLDLPVNPGGMLPKGKRKFVDRVFGQAGFNYTATLLSLAKVESAQLTPLHKDMRELLYLPHSGKRPTDMREIYSEEELLAISTIDKHFTNHK